MALAQSAAAGFSGSGRFFPDRRESGAARGEMLSPTSFDLARGETALGMGSGVSGQVRSATFTFQTPAAGPIAPALGVHVAVVIFAARQPFKVAGGKGLITGSAGNLNCGKTCAASLPAGTVVTLTVLPDPGFTFVSWSGACTGTAPTCTTTVTASATAQANLTK